MKQKMFNTSQLRRLIFPLLIEQLLVMLVGMVDTIMVSNAGEAAISGVSIVNDFNNLMISLLAALAGGGAVIVSQYLGNQDHENTQRSASQLVMISFLIAFVLGALCVGFHVQILNLLYGSVAMDVMQAARTYFWITALSFPFLGVYNSAAALFRSMSETKTTMYISILMNTINVLGNYILVYRMGMGSAGVAIPTLVSRIVGAFIMMKLAFREGNKIQITWKGIFRWDGQILRRILNIAIPNGLENGLFQGGKVIISTFIATYGTSQIAANGVTNSFSTLCYATEMAMQLSVVTVIGQCVGANDYDQADYYVKYLLKVSWILAVIDNVIVRLLAPLALQMYSLNADTMLIAQTILTMECIAVAVLHAPAFVLPTCLRASGDAKYTMYVGVASMFLARVAGAYILGTVMGMGVVGTRIAMYVDWVIRIAFFYHRYRSNQWRNFRAI